MAFYRAYAKIDLRAIEQNLINLQKKLHHGVKSMAVVKANAYGHGSVPVSKKLESRVDYFAVATLQEGIELRENGIKKPILVLSYTHPSLFSQLINFEITGTIWDFTDAQELSNQAQKLGKIARIHVAVDTGMGRIGVFADDTGAETISRIARLPFVETEGVFTHLACADSLDKTAANDQIQKFDHFLKLLEQKRVSIPIRHVSNSAASMEMENQYDMCRFGIALYGLYPSEEVSKESITLLPAMQVFSHVVQVKAVSKNTPIGYGHIYRTPSEKVIATVSIGYADGFRRCLTGVGHVLIRGKKAPVVGKVCMDQIMVDVTEIDGVTTNDRVTILGTDGDFSISAETLSSLCHSFNYELVSTFMPRVVRVYDEE